MGEKNCKLGKKKKIVALCMFVFIVALTTGAVSTTNQTRVEEEVIYDGVYLEDKNFAASHLLRSLPFILTEPVR